MLGAALTLARWCYLPSMVLFPVIGLVLVVYAIMCGMNPPVVRATIMALTILGAHHIGRERDWPTALSLAALVILLVNPFTLFNPGFQLSFAATWGILYLGPQHG